MPIDVEILKEKMEAGKKCVEKVRNQDILLLIGGTGSGKSLTIQFLAGSKIEKRDKVNDKGGILQHYEATEFPQNCDDELPLVTSSPHAESHTSYVRGVKIEIKEKAKFGKFVEKPFILCDSPGQLETRGIEQFLAQTYSTVKAAQASKSVRPVIVISKEGVGDRGELLRRIIDSISVMFRNIKLNKDSFNIIFTKYEDSKYSKGMILGFLANLFEELEKDPNLQDLSFKDLLEALGDKLESEDDVIIIDPLNSDRESILKSLLSPKAIDDPENAFTMSIS